MVETRDGDVRETASKARSLEKAGDRLAAMEVWRAHLAGDPYSAAAHGELGRLLFKTGKAAESVEHLRQAVGLAPSKKKTWKLLAQALRHESEGRFEAWSRVLELDPTDAEARQSLALLLLERGDGEGALRHAKALAPATPAVASDPVLIVGGKEIYFEQAGRLERGDYGHYRGERANFYPNDRSLSQDDAIANYFVKGLTPAAPPLAKDSCIVAFGSCFAAHISDYLHRLGFRVATKTEKAAYVSTMNDGIVNTYAIRQQFEWAWLGKQPSVDLWHGYDAKVLGYDESVRLATQRLFDSADAFIITLGLSEVWYDEPTGEVFWRAVPRPYFDPARHKFRVVRHGENLANIKAIYELIRARRPDAIIVFTLSPISLTATFRPVPCTVADSASKALLRSALDEFYWDAGPDERLFYFPSYEIAQRAFDRPYIDDRRHVYGHVLDFNMATFERYFCQTGLTDADLAERFRKARESDARMMREGHFAGWDIPLNKGPKASKG